MPFLIVRKSKKECNLLNQACLIIATDRFSYFAPWNCELIAKYIRDYRRRESLVCLRKLEGDGNTIWEMLFMIWKHFLTQETHSWPGFWECCPCPSNCNVTFVFMILKTVVSVSEFPTRHSRENCKITSNLFFTKAEHCLELWSKLIHVIYWNIS